jgi:hypothetical protein
VTFCGGAGFGHHGSNGVAPGLVMTGFFVSGGRIGSAISFDEHKTGWIILLLDDVKASDTGFLDALASVGKSGLFEGLDVFGLEMNVNVDDEHIEHVKSLIVETLRRQHKPLQGKRIRVCSGAQAFGEARAPGCAIAFGAIPRVFREHSRRAG